MKKKLLFWIILSSLVAVFATGVLAGCGNSEPDVTKKYVVFTNGYGEETYTLTYPDYYEVEFDYDEEKIYSFLYSAYYTDNDHSTGENGESFYTIKGNKPGSYSVTAKIWLGEYGYRDYTLVVTIKEKPDLRVMPEVRFDPNGATVEERDGKTVYVYKYDGKQHYPLIHLFYDDQEIELNLRNNGISSIQFNGDHYNYARPRYIGSYEIEYWIYDSRYANESDKEKYHEIRVTVFVEIQ